MDKAVLQDLLKRVEEATGADRELDAAVACAFVFKDLRPACKGDHGDDEFWRGNIYVDTGFLMADFFTRSIDANLALVEKMLPGWWATCGVCDLTGHASIGPDYNGPHGERLHREFPADRFDDGIHVDLGPKGGGNDRAARAIVACILRALLSQQCEATP
jgi:hypothetical protein